MRPTVLVAAAVFVSMAAASGSFDAPLAEHPAIRYAERPVENAATALNRQIQQGEVQLQFEEGRGYLRSVLAALHIPVESQMLVFSKTSFQAPRISPSNPRALYFNDSVAVGWVPGGPVVEIAAEDPRQGVVFYMLEQNQTALPQVVRHDRCIGCHQSYSSLGVPGMLVKSVFTAPDGVALNPLGSYITDDHSPFEQRWGGWYVTGKHGSMRHMGNAVVADPAHPEAMITESTLNIGSLQGRFDTDAYLSPYSDIIALMVFEHQMHVTNLLTHFGWEVRAAEYESKLNPSDAKTREGEAILTQGAAELADALLFINEASLSSRIEGSSGFDEKFALQSPADGQGRSLRQFDLQHRLMRYPCSYMIYSEAFEALPEQARQATYARLWQILSGADKSEKYARLTPADRQAVLEILRATKSNLPGYFIATN